MRVVGPGSMGVVNTDPECRWRAVIGGTPVAAGASGSSRSRARSASGCCGGRRELGLGVSSFVAVGNKADVSGNDVLQHWEDDDATDVVLLYLESFGNPRKFARVARRVARRKPVLAVRAGADPTVDALFRQTGVLRVETPERLFEAASVLATQPLPRGRRVAIVADAGGPALLGSVARRDARGSSWPAPVEIGFGTPDCRVRPMPCSDSLDDDDVDAVLVVLTDLSSIGEVPTGDKPVLVTLLSPDVAAPVPLARGARRWRWRRRRRTPSGGRDPTRTTSQTASTRWRRARARRRGAGCASRGRGARRRGRRSACSPRSASTAIGLGAARVDVHQDPTFGPGRSRWRSAARRRRYRRSGRRASRR